MNWSYRSSLSGLMAGMLMSTAMSAQTRPSSTLGVPPVEPDRRPPSTIAPAGLRHLTMDENDERDATFSARADFFAVSSNRSGTFELWLYPSRQGGIRQITMNAPGVQDVLPDWNPNATGIIFQSNRIGGVPNVWRYNFNERGLTQLTFAKHGAEAPKYSPDGNNIVYTAYDADGHRRIWMMDAEGRNPTEMIDGFDPSWSPDGRTIVFARAVREGTDRTTDIWLMNADGTDPRRLTIERAKSETAPRFSPDGRTIVYEMTWTAVESSGNEPQSRQILREIWMVDLDGSNARQVTTFAGARPNFTMDGRVVFSMTRAGSHDIWMIQPTVPNSVSRP